MELAAAHRAFRDLGAAGGDEIPTLGTLDVGPRGLTAPEFPQQLRTTYPAPAEDGEAL